MTSQKRQFRLDNHAISMLIQAQAGSLQKAILEAVANALDAGAGQVKIKITPERVEIEDNGRGFRDKEEIEKFFETFGFDHSQLDRKVGRFGVGRGQLFHFGKNHWITNGFTMDVDTKTDMFGYELGQARKPHKGVKIAIDLYEAMNFSELATVEAELKKLVKFSIIPVIINGKAAHKDPATMKWDAETDDAWFKLDEGYDLKVYSQGLFVQGLPAYQFGKGGVVVTKLGRALKQNMARNDMLTTDCEVWKRVRKTLSGLSNKQQEKASKTKSMNEDMRASIAVRSSQGDTMEDFDLLNETALFTLTNGKHVKLSALMATGFVAMAPNKDPSADILIQRKQAVVVNPQTLHRFKVETVEELRDRLVGALERCEKGAKKRGDWERQYPIQKLLKQVKACQFAEKVSDLPMQANAKLVEVKDREATPEERLALSIMRREIMPALTWRVWSHLHQDEELKNYWDVRQDTVIIRTLTLANGEGFLACTDGASKIWLDRKYLRNCIKQGPQGFIALASTLTHELLHDVDTSTGHDHDHQFYEAYHDLTGEGEVAGVGLHAYRRWLARGGKATMYAIREMEKANLIESSEAGERLAALSDPAAARATTDAELAEDAVAAEAEAPKAPRRRKPR